MDKKGIIFEEEAQQKLIDGCQKVYATVTTTLGPKGKNVALQRPYGRPAVVHDGVAAAREVTPLEDGFENMGADLIIEAAEKTNDKAGDGTTTAILLAYELIKEGFKHVSNGENPQIFKEELKQATKKVIDYLDGLKKEIKNPSELIHISTIAANDPEVGKMVAESFKRVGKDGAVTVDIGHQPETEVEFKEGMVVPKGYITPYFMTNPDNLKAELEDVPVLVTDEEISSIIDILPLLKEIAEKQGKKIFIVAENVTGQALQTLVLNKGQGTLRPLAIQAPGGGEGKQNILEDICIYTGAVLFSEKAGRKLSDVTFGDLGRAGKIVTDRNETVIMDGKGAKVKIRDRIREIKKRLEEAKTDFEREGFEERLARLSGGVAVIYAGGSSDTESKEKRLRIEDAINAAKAAMAEGVIPGGGVALYHARGALDPKANIGERILSEVLDKQLLKLIENSGLKEHLILGKLDPLKPTKVYNITTGEFGDAFKMGVVDPLKVVRLALENAVSVAAMILTTGACVGIVPKESDDRVPAN